MDTDKPTPQVAGFRTEAVLGEGGMATVYLAVQESLSRHVALKVMNRILVADADFRQRFLNEGRLIAQLSHPNIVTVYDIGVWENIHYLSMTYLPGGTLADKIREGLKPERALYILKCLADALGYAHSQGIVHRDIKPGNVLFTDSGAPVLTDFGIAKTIGNETQLTSTGMTVGSAGYMSPEQALGHKVDNRSDLYSLGVLLWKMLTGDLPYDAPDPFALAFKHANDPIPELPENLRQFQSLVDDLLAKKPEDRPASAEELLRAMDETSYDGIRASVPPNSDETVVLPRFPEQIPSRPRVASEAGAQPALAPKRRLRIVTTLTAISGLAALAGYLGYIGPFSPPLDVPPAARSAPPDSKAQAESVLGPRRPAARSEDLPREAGLPSAALPESRNEQSADAKQLQTASPAGAQGDEQRTIAVLLRRAQEQWKAGRLVEPAGDNAFESYSKVLELDPEYAEVRQNLVQIGRISAANKMFLSAESLLRQGELDAARRMIETGLKINPNDERLLGLERALDFDQ
jgi:serine/threonine-protein kinase PpkA